MELWQLRLVRQRVATAAAIASVGNSTLAFNGLSARLDVARPRRHRAIGAEDHTLRHSADGDRPDDKQNAGDPQRPVVTAEPRHDVAGDDGRGEAAQIAAENGEADR